MSVKLDSFVEVEGLIFRYGNISEVDLVTPFNLYCYKDMKN